MLWRWEYVQAEHVGGAGWQVFPEGLAKLPGRVDLTAEMLNSLGEQGWELVAVTGHARGGPFTYTFKRLAIPPAARTEY